MGEQKKIRHEACLQPGFGGEDPLSRNPGRSRRQVLDNGRVRGEVEGSNLCRKGDSRIGRARMPRTGMGESQEMGGHIRKERGGLSFRPFAEKKHWNERKKNGQVRAPARIGGRGGRKEREIDFQKKGTNRGRGRAACVNSVAGGGNGSIP